MPTQKQLKTLQKLYDFVVKNRHYFSLATKSGFTFSPTYEGFDFDHHLQTKYFPESVGKNNVVRMKNGYLSGYAWIEHPHNGSHYDDVHKDIAIDDELHDLLSKSLKESAVQIIAIQLDKEEKEKLELKRTKKAKLRLRRLVGG